MIHQFSEGANDLRQRLGRLLASGHADPAQSADFSRNLTSLRDASLVSMALFSGGLGYLWIVLIMWPAPGVPNTPASWAGSLALVVSASIALLVKGRLPYLAGQILLWGSVASITFALTLYSVSQAAYLFIVPITFANVIHGRWTVFLIAGAGISMTWGLHMMRDSDSAFAALQTIGLTEPPQAKVMQISDTLHLGEVIVSEAFLPLLAGRNDLQALEAPREMTFDANGQLVDV